MKRFLFLLVTTLSFFMSPGAFAQEKASFKSAILAGGCFSCMEQPFERLDGVVSVVSGYTGGFIKDPSYKQVSSGSTGHYEAVKITYNPEVISYDALLEVFWRNIDPFDDSGQFCDKGAQYKAAIFYSYDEEKEKAEASKLKMTSELDQQIVTEILPAKEFYEAEEYHQDYYLKKPYRYKFYRGGCGRDKRLKQVWDDQAGGYDLPLD
jgi:methionine-S-sulfoxide reductase